MEYREVQKPILVVEPRNIEPASVMSNGNRKSVTTTDRKEEQPSLFDDSPRETMQRSCTGTTTDQGSKLPQDTTTKECFVRLVDVAAGFKRKFDEIAEKKRCNQDDTVAPAKRPNQNGHSGTNGDNDVDTAELVIDEDMNNEEESDDIDEEEGGGSSGVAVVGGGGDDGPAKKRKRSPRQGPIGSMKRLIDMEDRAPLCILGETESNMFPKTVELMNHTVPIIYDSRVHMWFKADDFAKALGYKNYKSSVEKYVNPNFVLPYPNVLDLSRARYGDAFRLYSVNNKTAFINEAGAVQLLLRWLISGHSQQQRQQQVQQEMVKHNIAATANAAAASSASATSPILCSLLTTPTDASVTSPEPTVTAQCPMTAKTSAVKPKLSADWIDYQLQPALLAFSNAAKNGKTARDLRYDGMM